MCTIGVSVFGCVDVDGKLMDAWTAPGEGMGSCPSPLDHCIEPLLRGSRYEPGRYVGCRDAMHSQTGERNERRERPRSMWMDPSKTGEDMIVDILERSLCCCNYYY